MSDIQELILEKVAFLLNQGYRSEVSNVVWKRAQRDAQGNLCGLWPRM